MSNLCKLTTASFILLLVVSVGFCSLSSVFAQSDDAASKLQLANSAINSAFDAVSDAEKAGANVTDLLSQLNGAADSLAQAEIAYRQADYTTAIIKSDEVVLVSGLVVDAAQNEKQAASDAKLNLFLANNYIINSWIYYLCYNFKYCLALLQASIH